MKDLSKKKLDKYAKITMTCDQLDNYLSNVWGKIGVVKREVAVELEKALTEVGWSVLDNGASMNIVKPKAESLKAQIAVLERAEKAANDYIHQVFEELDNQVEAAD